MSPNAKPWQKTAQAGPDTGVAMYKPEVATNIIKAAKRPVLVIGAMSLKWKLGDEPYIALLIRLAKAANLPIIATAHSNKYISDNKITDVNVVVMPLVNLTNR